MKTSHALLAFSVLLASLPLAHAAPPAATTTVPFASLPVGEISQPIPLGKLPRPSSSKAEGFYIKREQHDYVTIRGKKPPADAARRFGMTTESACLRGSTDMFGSGGIGEKPTWASQSESTMSMGAQQPRLTVHREEVVLTGGRAMLETRDAVIDTRSLASKTVDQRSLPLGKVAEMVGGVQVFAMRSQENVEFVVLVPDRTLGSQAMLMAHLSGNPQIITSGQCRHIRVTTPIKKGEGTAASVVFRVLDTDPSGAAPTDDGTGMVQRTLRTLAVHLSTSWLSGDAEPVISASSGWQGPSERQRVSIAALGTMID